MKNIVNKFIDTKNELNKYFNCTEDFFIKPLINNQWTIKDKDGIFFLTYLDNNNPKDCVIVKKNNEPMIFKTNEYTMIIGIECVKLAFILKNCNEV